MKYGSRQSQGAHNAVKPGAKGKGSAANTGSEGNTRRLPPGVVLEPEADASALPLLSHPDSESWLGERLKQHGCDLYVDGNFPTFRDRLRHVILENRMAHMIVGRHDGKPETYWQTFERLYGEALNAPRGTSNKTGKTG